MRYIVFLFYLTVDVVSILAKTIEINSFTPQPFDLTASIKQKMDLNGIPCALVKFLLPEGMAELRIEGNLVDQTFDGSEIHAYITSGTKSIIIKAKGYTPYVLNFSDYGVYRLLSKQVYVLDLKISLSSVSNIYNSIPHIYESLDISNDEDPIDNMVKEANDLYSNGRIVDAIPLLEKAASLGHTEALLSLGLLYEKGVGTKDNWILKPNATKAFKHIQNSAQQGYAAAQKILYRYYLTGVGVDADKSRAETWKSVYETNIKSPDSESGDNKVFTKVEQMPEYPGGEKNMFKDLNRLLVYPKLAQENDIQGKITLRFVIREDGSIDEIKVLKSSIYYIKESKKKNGEVIIEKIQMPKGDKELENTAIEAVRRLEKFYPGRNNGVPVRVWYILPITFKLS